MRRALVLVCTAAVVATGFGAITATPAGAAPIAYTIQVDGDISEGCRLATIDLATGTVTGIGSFLDYDSYACAQDLAFGPDGVLYGISDNERSIEPGGQSGVAAQGPVVAEAEVHLVRFDTTTGAVTDVGRIGTDEATLAGQDGAGGIAFDANGVMFVAMVGITDACNDEAFCLYRVDPANVAAPSFVGPMLGQIYFFSLAASCTTIYSSQQLEDSESVLTTVDPTDAVITPVGTKFSDTNTINALEIDPATGTLYGLGSTRRTGFGSEFVYTIDTTTGASTPGPEVSAYAIGLAIGAPNCITPTPPPPVVVTPAFTG